jgi:N-succinyl-L-ornithine transcarbamylase
VQNQDASWMITQEKMAVTNDGRFMHCLPVRRNVVVSDTVIESPRSLHLEQSHNRTWAAMAAIKELLKSQ